MIQIIITIAVLVLVFGGLLAITLSRKEGKELQKSCGCSVTGDKDSCVSSCD